MRARKRHRGGGGLAVPGPFKRIARAGGQKVTIRTAQRPFFGCGSALPKIFKDFFGCSRNDQSDRSSGWEDWQIHAVPAEPPVERGAKLLGQAADDPLELNLVSLARVVRH